MRQSDRTISTRPGLAASKAATTSSQISTIVFMPEDASQTKPAPCHPTMPGLIIFFGVVHLFGGTLLRASHATPCNRFCRCREQGCAPPVVLHPAASHPGSLLRSNGHWLHAGLSAPS